MSFLSPCGCREDVTLFVVEPPKFKGAYRQSCRSGDKESFADLTMLFDSNRISWYPKCYYDMGVLPLFGISVCFSSFWRDFTSFFCNLNKKINSRYIIGWIEFTMQVGMIAVNDGILLRNHIARILKKHFRDKPYYVDLLDLFNEVILFCWTCFNCCDTNFLS